MSVEVDLSQIGKLQTMLGGAANVATTGMPAILDDVANAVVAQARMNAPRDTDELYNSIAVTRRAGTAVNRIRWVGSPVKQAFFTEFGTYKMPPQPWLTPAAEAGVDKLVEAMAELGEIW